ncbi:MAG: hypothetical protein RIC55_28960 [Pirellulaceae bacterium]
MFEFQHLSGIPPEGIALQTRRGRDIRNSLGLVLTERHFRLFELLRQKHGANWELRKPPSGEYNCAGHVWASRRVCIYEEADWRWILADDGYRQAFSPVADDLVVYVEREQGILHIGRVLELRAGLVQGAARIPWVVSKWSDVAGEACHYVHDHPFRDFGFMVSIEYWTDRPASEESL